MTDLTTELEARAAAPERKTIRDLMEENALDLAAKLPKGLDFEYFKQAVYSEHRRNPKLYEVDPLSVVSAVAFALQLGLSPGPLGHCYLVPFKTECQFIIGYKGMIDLAFRSGKIKDVKANLVREGDHFDFREGTRPYLDHAAMLGDTESPIIAAYAVARTTTGGAPFAIITEADWQAAQKRSPAGSKNLGPWRDDWAAMVRKTAVRRLQPFLPQSPMFAEALAWDEHAAPLVGAPEGLESPPGATVDDEQV